MDAGPSRPGASAPRTPSQSHSQPPRSQGLSTSAKRRRVDRTPRQVLAHEQGLQQSAAKERAAAAGGAEEEEDGALLGGRRRSVGRVNKMQTPQSYLQRLAGDPALPAPTPDPEPPRSPPRAGPSHAAMNFGLSPVSPAKSIFSSPGGQSDDDVLSQLLPAPGPPGGHAFPSNREGPFNPFERPSGRSSPKAADGRHKPLFAGTTSSRADRNRPLDLSIRPRASGESVTSEVESQVGRNRPSTSRMSFGSVLAGSRSDDEELGGPSRRASSARGSGVFAPADDRVFRSPPAGKGPPESAPMGRTLSSLSSPDRPDDAPADEAELDVDLPEEEDNYVIGDDDALSAPMNRRASSALSVSMSSRRVTPLPPAPVGRRVVSASPEMDMDLGTDDEGSGASSDAPRSRQQKVKLDAAAKAKPQTAVETPRDFLASARREVESELEEGEVGEDELEPAPELDDVGLGGADQSIPEIPVPADFSFEGGEAAAGAEDDLAPPDFEEEAVPRADSPLYEPALGDDEQEEEVQEPEDEEEEDEDLFGDLAEARPVKRTQAKVAAPSTQKRRKRPQRFTSAGIAVPELPRALVKDLFSHFSGKSTRAAPDTLDAVMDASHDFFAQLMEDASKAADRRSGTARVSEADLIKVMKKSGIIGPKVSVQSLGRKFGLPKELQAVLDTMSIEQAEKKGSGKRKRKSN